MISVLDESDAYEVALLVANGCRRFGRSWVKTGEVFKPVDEWGREGEPTAYFTRELALERVSDGLGEWPP